MAAAMATISPPAMAAIRRAIRIFLPAHFLNDGFFGGEQAVEALEWDSGCGAQLIHPHGGEARA